MKDKCSDLQRTKQLGDELAIYVLQMRQNLEAVQHASLWDRNPYWRSKRAKDHLKTLENSVDQCVTTILHYTAALAKQHIASSMELKGYFFMYDFLFRFHDGIIRQELEHCILTKDIEITAKFYQFFEQSDAFIRLQKQKIDCTFAMDKQN